jgi:hypothetical protein
MGITDLRLANVPADSVSVSHLNAAARRTGYGTFARPAYFCSRIEFDSPEQRLQISRSARRNSKKTRNALARMGAVTLEHRRSWAEIADEFAEFAAANVGRFLAEGRISNLVSKERRQFLSELAQVLSPREWMTLTTLKLNERTIAWQLGFQFANTWLWYLPAFDASLQDLHPGPGTYLLYQILQEASQQPELHAIDLGLGNEGYKQQHARDGRQTLDINLSRAKTRLAAERIRYSAGELAKKSPFIERYARRCIAGISQLRLFVEQGHASKRLISTMRKRFSSPSGLLFLEATPIRGQAQNCGLELSRLSLKLLAMAAMEFHRENGALESLMHAARHLRSPEYHGFALLTKAGVPVHISLVSPFEGARLPDLKEPIHEPVPDSVLIETCWTAQSWRSDLRDAEFAAAIAAHLLENHKRPWVFTRNAEISQLQVAGFVPRFSIVRNRRILFGRASRLKVTTQQSGRTVDLYPAA